MPGTRSIRRMRNFYPRPPRGGRLRFAVTAKRRKGFLSTPSARRATQPASCTPSTTGNFYPRPPRGGRPKISFGCSAAIENFYPRPPRGGRPLPPQLPPQPPQFLSTPSARRATRHPCRQSSCWQYFYPRPPRGGRLGDRSHQTAAADFYPRPPRGGRLGKRYAGADRY